MSQADQFAAEPPERGMSTGAKIFLGLGGGCLVVLLLCCGGFMLLGFAIAPIAEQFAEEFGEEIERVFEEGWTEDPFLVEEATQQLASIRIPESFRPEGTFRFRESPIWVVYEGDDFDGTLILMRAKLGPVTVDGQEIVDWIEREIARNREDHSEVRINVEDEFEIVIDESQKRDFVIGGEQASFVFARGHKRGSEEAFQQVVGSFQGEDTPVFLLLFAEEGALSEDEIVEMIESIE